MFYFNVSFEQLNSRGLWRVLNASSESGEVEVEVEGRVCILKPANPAVSVSNLCLAAWRRRAGRSHSAPLRPINFSQLQQKLINNSASGFDLPLYFFFLIALVGKQKTIVHLVRT